MDESLTKDKQLAIFALSTPATSVRLPSGPTKYDLVWLLNPSFLGHQRAQTLCTIDDFVLLLNHQMESATTQDTDTYRWLGGDGLINHLVGQTRNYSWNGLEWRQLLLLNGN